MKEPTQEPMTAEQLAEQATQWILSAPQIATPEMKYKIKETITQATEAKDREIERLESQNALLVEALRETISELDPVNIFNCHDDDYLILNEKVITRRAKLRETLTSTSRAAQERDARLREAVIDECINACEQELDEAGDILARLDELKQGGE